jgi:hypothetical protein
MDDGSLEGDRRPPAGARSTGVVGRTLVTSGLDQSAQGGDIDEALLVSLLRRLTAASVEARHDGLTQAHPHRVATVHSRARNSQPGGRSAGGWARKLATVALRQASSGAWRKPSSR